MAKGYLTNYKFPCYVTFTIFLLRFLCYLPIFSSTGVHKTLALVVIMTRFCRVEPHVCGSPVRNLLHSTLPLPKLWGGFKIFGKSVHPCSSTLFFQISSAYASLLSWENIQDYSTGYNAKWCRCIMERGKKKSWASSRFYNVLKDNISKGQVMW